MARIYADGTCRVPGPVTGQRPHALGMTELSCSLTCVHNTQIGTSRPVALAGAALRHNGGYLRAGVDRREH
jgi:hypothetical protein